MLLNCLDICQLRLSAAHTPYSPCLMNDNWLGTHKILIY